ncbi:recombinase family protein [Anaerosinus sp.]|uniref:recombinase family protein n=1 Tax=Selenobaculum sp. TaxID=3074374 RepID=UPI003AB32B54
MQKLRTVAYCRVSTDHEEQLNSLSEQQNFFESYTKENNMELVELYVDEGISGTKLKNRTEFLRMMRDAKLGKFDILLVKDISRLARNVVDFVQSVRTLKALNIDCKFITANMSATDGELTLTIMAAVAQEESANTSKRVKFTKINNAKKGRVPNLVLGYNKVDNFTLEINQTEAKIVRKIFVMYANQGMGTKKIAKELNKQGIRTKLSSQFTPAGVKSMLKNQLYMGRLVTHKTETTDFLTGKRKNVPLREQFIFERPQWALVSPELFWQVQKLFAERNEKMKKNMLPSQSFKRIFSTLIQCGECGKAFRARDFSTLERNYTLWFCNGRSAMGVEFCKNDAKLDEKELYATLQEYLISQVQDEKLLLKNVIKCFREKYYSNDNDKVSLSELETELNVLMRLKEKKIKLFEMEVITADELKFQIDEILQKIKVKEEQIRAIKMSSGDHSELELLVQKYCSTVQDALKLTIMDNTMLKRIVDRIIVHCENRIEIHMKIFSDVA